MAGLMAREIKIHNDSDKTISLIPFSCKDGENPPEFVVRQKLAKNIPASGHIVVKPKDYDLSGEGPEFQIRILFRAGEIPEKVKPEKGEKVFLYTGLAAKAKWELKFDKKGQVKGGPDNAAGPTSSGANAAGPQIESQLRELNDKVKELQNKVEVLQKKVKDLEKRLDTFSTNTPSSSK